jgi:hypothetical protein
VIAISVRQHAAIAPTAAPANTATLPPIAAPPVSERLINPPKAPAHQSMPPSRGDIPKDLVPVMMPAVDLGDVTKDVHSVVYVCDASGSMMNKMVPLKKQLKISIDQLQPSQFFSIIFFADQKPQALAQQLVMASPDNKRKAYDFLYTVNINTITFVSDSDNDVEFIKNLTDIAKENGGTFERIKLADLPAP